MAGARPTLAERMVRAARELQHEPDPQTTMDTAVRLATTNVRGCESAGITLVRRGGEPSTPAATDDLAIEGDRLQYSLSEGPCLEALWEERVVHSTDLKADERWPRWGPLVAGELGVRSMLCFQLFTHSDRLGALNLYARQPESFDATDIDDGLALAAHISVAVAASQQVEQLSAALDTRTIIGQACGIVMERYSLDANRAFDVLVRVSSQSNVKLREVALEFVTTRTLPKD